MATYAFSDLHGRLDLFKAIKQFVKQEDKLIYLGDSGDRGPQPWETLKEVLRDSQVTYIKGNHDDMLAKAMVSYYDGEMRDIYGWEVTDLLRQNGGRLTFEQWISEGAEIEWASRIDRCHKYYIYENINDYLVYCSHAGFGAYELDNNLANVDLLWNRYNIGTPNWPERYSNIISVHGHTPTRLIRSWQKDEAFWYGNNHAVDIDCGAYKSGKVCLLDLDTFDEHYIELESD